MQDYDILHRDSGGTLGVLGVAVTNSDAGSGTAVGGVGAGVVLNVARALKGSTEADEIVRARNNESTATSGNGGRERSTNCRDNPST